MLNTTLPHTESDDDFKTLVENHENVMLCCGRMGPMCLPVYDVMNELAPEYGNVKFADMDFDGPASHNIRKMPAVRNFMSLPFTIYFKNGEPVEATSSVQTIDQVKTILDKHFK